MANIIRTAKSSYDWTLNDLAAYHISLNKMNALAFFDIKPAVDEEVLNKIDADSMQQDRHAKLINLIDLAMIPEEGETIIVTLITVLLRLLDYSSCGRLVRSRVELPLLVCGESRVATTSACVTDLSSREIFLVAQEEKEKGATEPVNAEAQLVAEAIAAFNKMNSIRESKGLSPFEEKIIPGIVMIGTSPIFFQIPVSQILSRHVQDGTYSPEEMRVVYCYPSVPHPDRRFSEGMMPLDNRREILQFYEAFKGIVGIKS